MLYPSVPVAPVRSTRSKCGQGIPLVPTFPVDYAVAMRWLCTSIRSFATRPEQSLAQHGSAAFRGDNDTALVAAFCIKWGCLPANLFSGSLAIRCNHLSMGRLLCVFSETVLFL